MKKGFTLLELLIAITIFVILGLIVVPNIANIVGRNSDSGSQVEIVDQNKSPKIEDQKIIDKGDNKPL